jgi:hypothetical protein
LTQQQLVAVVASRDFLARLSRPSESTMRWGPVRLEARALLRQFPLESELLEALEQPID